MPRLGGLGDMEQPSRPVDSVRVQQRDFLQPEAGGDRHPQDGAQPFRGCDLESPVLLQRKEPDPAAVGRRHLEVGCRRGVEEAPPDGELHHATEGVERLDGGGGARFDEEAVPEPVDIGASDGADRLRGVHEAEEPGDALRVMVAASAAGMLSKEPSGKCGERDLADGRCEDRVSMRPMLHHQRRQHCFGFGSGTDESPDAPRGTGRVEIDAELLQARVVPDAHRRKFTIGRPLAQLSRRCQRCDIPPLDGRMISPLACNNSHGGWRRRWQIHAQAAARFGQPI